MQPYDPKKRAQGITESTAGMGATCRHLRNENVGNESAAVHAKHENLGDSTTVDDTLWVPKSRGLPLRQVIEMDMGEKFGKSHTDVRFDYAYVYAPADAR